MTRCEFLCVPLSYIKRKLYERMKDQTKYYVGIAINTKCIVASVYLNILRHTQNQYRNIRMLTIFQPLADQFLMMFVADIRKKEYII